MPAKILHLCLVLVTICIKHETSSQAIVDFKCKIEFPICQKPGVAREDQDLVTFSIVLYMEYLTLDFRDWQTVAVMLDDVNIVDNYRRRNWLTYMDPRGCKTRMPRSIEYRKPYAKCRQDPNSLHYLKMELGVMASTRYNMSTLIAVWFNQALSYKISKSVRYPMVLFKVEEKLRIDYKDMPGKNAYILPGNYHVFQYCVTVRDTGWSMIYFKIGNKPDLSYTRDSRADRMCPSYPVITTRADLNQIMIMSYREVEGPCIMYVNTTGLILDVALTSSSKSKANELRKQPMERVLILVTLSGAAMWMPSKLNYHG